MNRWLVIMFLCAAPAFAEKTKTSILVGHCVTTENDRFVYGLTTGYILGVYTAENFTAPPGTTVGDIRDAVCGYLAEHKDLWELPESKDVASALKALYPNRGEKNP
ncbi:MAG: Rap1a/Tai family immunity protein [Candidatus Sulfotelmatobacter sp.]